MENKISEFFEKIKNTFEEVIIQSSASQKFPFFEVKADSIKQVLSFCYHDSTCGFDFLEGITTVEENTDFIIHYHLFSTSFSHRVHVKFKINAENCKIGSVTSIWKSASVFEKEVKELLGISFEGSVESNFEKDIIFKAKEGIFPLRKSFKVKAEDEMVL